MKIVKAYIAPRELCCADMKFVLNLPAPTPIFVDTLGGGMWMRQGNLQIYNCPWCGQIIEEGDE